MDSQRMINRQLNLLESIATQYNDNINEYNRNISDVLTIFSNAQHISTRSSQLPHLRSTNTRGVTTPNINYSNINYSNINYSNINYSNIND